MGQWIPVVSSKLKVQRSTLLFCFLFLQETTRNHFITRSIVKVLVTNVQVGKKKHTCRLMDTSVFLTPKVECSTPFLFCFKFLRETTRIHSITSGSCPLEVIISPYFDTCQSPPVGQVVSQAPLSSRPCVRDATFYTFYSACRNIIQIMNTTW